MMYSIHDQLEQRADYKVLIIDQGKSILNLLSGALENSYCIIAAADWQSASAVLSEEPIKLIVSPMTNSEKDGVELCISVKSDLRYCHIPFILIGTAITDREFLSALKAGADAYMQPPFSLELIHHQIANLLENRARIRVHINDFPGYGHVLEEKKSDRFFLERLEDYLSNNIKVPNLNIDHLSADMNMSRATFYRKVKLLYAQSPKDLIDITRLKKAAELIAKNEFSFFEIARMVGYSPSSFNRNFKKHFKSTPMDYLNMLAESKNPGRGIQVP